MKVYNANVKHSQKKNEASVCTDLNQLEGRYHFLVNQATAIVTIIDRNGIIIYQSPSVQQILGYEVSTRIGKNLLRSKIVHPEDAHIKEQLLAKTFKHPGKNLKAELRMKHKNGKWSWMEVIFNNQLDNADIQGIVVVTHDISDRKKLELQKNEFLSIASHELKTPLTTIRAYSQLMLGRIEKDKKCEEYLPFLEKIVSQTDKIAHLINELLDVSKIQEGQLSVTIRPFDMRTMITKLLDDFHYISDSHAVKLTGSKRLCVLGDETRIGQVVINLLTNAIKYSPKGSDIVVHVAKKGDAVITSVTDYGEGIPVKMQKYIFQRFFRIKESTAQDISSGLGLYIASEIIKLHSGKIWLKSRKGSGSTFYFSLPIVSKAEC